jgi:SpoVK/Ycf46/Vps4 family AAA+-type ATPase
MKFFEDKSNNLMVFYGPPGCGKTNFIKNMITKCENDVIYVPPSMVSIISEPSFVSFMLQNQGCTLIVEDAEQILCGDRNSATTNLLNLTDGFLKDSLKIKVVATMNADIKAIDSALLRKGRLHISHHFGKLSVKDANRLGEHCGISHIFDDEIALCDVFNVEEFDSPLKQQERAIGFGNF